MSIRKNTTQESDLEKRELIEGDLVVIKLESDDLFLGSSKQDDTYVRLNARHHGGMNGRIIRVTEFLGSDCCVELEDGTLAYFYRENLELDPRYLTKLGSLL